MICAEVTLLLPNSQSKIIDIGNLREKITVADIYSQLKDFLKHCGNFNDADRKFILDHCKINIFNERT